MTSLEAQSGVFLVRAVTPYPVPVTAPNRSAAVNTKPHTVLILVSAAKPII